MKLGPFSLLVLVFIGLIIGLVLCGLPLKVSLAALGGIAIFCVSFFYPLVVVVFLLCIIPFNILWMGVGITPLELVYVLTFVILAASWVLKRITWGIFYPDDPGAKAKSLKTPVSLPLMVFFCVAILACVIGVLRGHIFAHWGSDLNIIMYYGLCFMIPDMVKDKKRAYRIFLLIVVSMVMGLLKGIYEIITNPHPSRGVLGTQHITLSYINVTGLIVFIISVAIAAALGKGRKKAAFLFLSLFFGIMLLVSFARSLWVAAIFGLAFLFFVSLDKQRFGFLKLVLGAIVVFALYIEIALAMPSNNPLFESIHNIQKRYESIFTAKEEPTIMTRQMEKEAAMQKALRHPFLGNGLGTQITYFRYDRWFGGQTWLTTRYIHNSYLYLFLNMGLLGLVSFLWFCAYLISYGMRLYKILKDEMDKALTLGITCAFMSLMVASLAAPILTSPTVTMWFGFFIGSLVIIDRDRLKQEP
jgi:O-antigen ligase